MEYYDVTRIGYKSYYDLVEKPVRSSRMKLELLDHFENCIGCIEQDIDSSSAGSIVSNNEQGCRRSCSFTLINVDDKYTLDENNFFWFNRKFRLFLGLTNGIDTFWFTKGVFITSSANCDSTAHTVDISGVDKYAQLNGDLNVLQADEMDTIFEIGTKIEDVIKDILMLDMGNGYVLDPIEPIIDPEIAKQKLYREYTLSAGGYYGDFLTEIMTCFGCDIFYDALGRLTVSRVFNDDIPYWYAFKSPAYRFNYNIHGYIAPSLSADLKGVNKIIVSTDNTECENAEYTAINHNPRSPLCYDKIGARTLPENGGIITIDAGDPAYGTTEKKCRDYAEYRMMKETCVALSVHFNTIPLHHLNEGDVISITDDDFGLYEDGFLIQSITYPLDTGELSIEAVNLKYLNTDIYIDSLYTEIREVEYRIMYNANGGKGWISSNIVTSNDETFTASTGYDATEHEDLFSRNGYEFTYWTDNENNKYYAGQSYENPMKNTMLLANWVDITDREFIIEFKDATTRTITPSMFITGRTTDDVESLQVKDKKYYFYGRGQNNIYFSVALPDGDFKLIHRSTGGTYNSIYAVLNLGRYGGYSAKFPNFMTTVSMVNNFVAAFPYKKITFPKSMTTINTSSGSGYTSVNVFYQFENIEELDFNNTNPVTINAYATSTTTRYFVCDCPNLKKLTFGNNVSFINTGSMASGSQSYYFFLNLLTADVEIKGDLTLGKMTVFSKFTQTSDTENTIKINGRLTLNDNNSSFANTVVSANTNVVIGSIVQGDYGTVLAASTLKSVTVTDSLSIESNKSVLVGMTLTEPVKLNDVTITYGTLLCGNHISEIDIMGDFEHAVTATSVMCGNPDLTTVKFYGDVTVGTSASSFCCNGNTNLTDVYFYTDNLTHTTPEYTGNLFANNNADFKIHGIANGTVQTFAETLGIPFVALTAEEIEEANNI